MAALIGGPFSFAGPIVGAVVYLGMKELIVRFTEYWLLVFGLVLLGVVLAFRGGLLGAAEALLSRRPWTAVARPRPAPRKDAA
jgi:branched-chain amino acid transport system permease protein